jgi:hypothetical protein
VCIFAFFTSPPTTNLNDRPGELNLLHVSGMQSHVTLGMVLKTSLKCICILAEYLPKSLHPFIYIYINSKNAEWNISNNTEEKHHQFYRHKYSMSLFNTLVAFLKQWA